MAQEDAGDPATEDGVFHSRLSGNDLARGTLQTIDASQAISSPAWRDEPDRYCWRRWPDGFLGNGDWPHQAEGSFDSVTGVTSAGAYTLQLNTAPFSTSACSGSPNPANCQGWEQFVYPSSGGGLIHTDCYVWTAGTLLRRKDTSAAPRTVPIRTAGVRFNLRKQVPSIAWSMQ